MRLRRRRKKKRNPDTGAMFAGIGGFALIPFPANVVSVFSAMGDGNRAVPVLLHAGVGALSAWGALRSSAEATRWALGGGALSSFLNAALWATVFGRPSVEPAMLHATYQGQPAPAAPPALPLGGAQQWLAFNPQAPMVPLMKGVRYRAAIDLPFGAGVLATDERVKAKAREMGFSDVAVFQDSEPPPQSGWTDPFGKIGDADLFVEATYVAEPKWLERNERIVSAWAFT